MADAWPTTNIVTTDMDAGSDNAGVARADINLMAGAVNDMMGQPPMGSGFVAESATTHTHAVTENGKIVVCTNATNCTVTVLAAATAAAQFANGFIAGGAGTITFTGTIAGLTNPVVKAGEGCILYTDGSNWEWHFFPAYHAPVTNYVSGRIIYLDDSETSASGVNISSLIGASYESFGPVGSGATNIVAMLNVVPSGVVGVMMRIESELRGSSNATVYEGRYYARRTGSTASVSGNHLISRTGFFNRSGSEERDPDFSMVPIPVDSSVRFDLYEALTGTSPTASTTIRLAGWILP